MTDQRPIVFLDTETTGLHADRRPWEIAWIRREPDGTETERCIQIADVDLSNAELKGLQIGRFHERWEGGPRAVEFLTACDFIAIGSSYENLRLEVHAAQIMYTATRDAIIVGAVPSFDAEVLAAMLRRHKLCPAWHYQLVDVETLAAGWLTNFPGLIPGTDDMDDARDARGVAEMELRRARESGDATKIAAAQLVVSDAMEAGVQACRKAVAEFVAPPWRSDDLSRACGVEPPAPEERHTALGDARWVKRWYDHIMGSAA